MANHSSGYVAVVLLLGLIAPLAHAADARLKKNPFWESVQPDVDVSGMVVVGLTSQSMVSGRDLPRIEIRPPHNMAGRDVCLTVQSRDGVYFSRNTYVLPTTIDDNAINLPYDQSRELALLRKYPARHLGIAVTEGDCANPGKRLLKPYAPNEPADGRLDVMINGLGATDVFYSVSKTAVNGVCDALRDGRTTVFDFWCRISVPHATNAQDMKIRIERERYGRELAPATLIVMGRNSSS